ALARPPRPWRPFSMRADFVAVRRSRRRRPSSYSSPTCRRASQPWPSGASARPRPPWFKSIFDPEPSATGDWQRFRLVRGEVEHGHADGDSGFDLVEDYAVLAVGDVVGDFDAAVQGTRVHDDRLRLRQ